MLFGWLVGRQMAFFHQLIAELEHMQDASPRGGDYFGLRRESRRTIDVPEEVLKFAPKKMRLRHQTAEDRIEQLETEIKQWQDRAGRAETRLQVIEKSIQQIASKYVRCAPRK